MEETTELFGPLNEPESPLNYNFVIGEQSNVPLDKFSGSDEDTNLPPVLNVKEDTDEILLKSNIDFENSSDDFRNATDQSSTDEKAVVIGRFEQEDLKKDLGTENADLLTGLPKEESPENSSEKPTDVTLPKEEKTSVEDDGEKSETDVVKIQPEAKSSKTVTNIASLEPEEKVSPEVLEAIANGEAQELLVSLDTTEIDALVEARIVEEGLEPGSDEILEYKAELLAELKAEVFSDLPEGFEIIDDYGNLPISFVRFESEAALQELLENDNVLGAAVPEVYEKSLIESLPIINQPEAEAAGYTGDGTTVAVLDTGAVPNAPGLEGRVVVAQDFAPDDGQDDDDGHGTNVSAIVAGVAPETNIAALDVFEGGFYYDQYLISAFDWIIENRNTYNIEAINMSLGNDQKFTDPRADNGSALGQAIAEAKSAGILSIVASGNEYYTDGISSPAAFESAVSVGATYDSVGTWGNDLGEVDRVAIFSNSSQFLDILAPGAWITAGGLERYTGTSMAAPHVAGAVAVLSEAFPDESPDQILQRMLNSGEPITDHRNGITKPRLNLGAALEIESSRPDNDNFLDSEILFGTSDSDSGTNVGATEQSGEPNHDGFGGGNSLWWSWTAPSSGEVTVNTFGSDFDTVLAAYTGASVSNLSEVTSNDNSGSNLQSEIVFDAVGGTTYHFAVDGYLGATGNIDLDLSLQTIAVDNDNFSNSISLSGSSASTTGNNIDATIEFGEPFHAGNFGGSSVWWNWTAPSTGTVTIGTNDSDFDTILGIYTGSSVSNLTEVASDDNGGDGLQSQVTFDVVEGTNYKIAVDGYFSFFNDFAEQGNIFLDIALATSQISNDDFDNSANLSGTSDNATASSINASIEFGEPFHAGNSGGHSLWWNWTAPNSGLVTIDTFGSDFDTLLAAYTGSSVSNLIEIVSNDDSSGLQSQIVFPAEAGTNYQIAVDGYAGAAGNVELALLLETDTLVNDNFAGRISLSGSQINETATNENATVESAEPFHAGNIGGASLWWDWTAPSDGTLIVNTGGSDFDTILAAYTGLSLSNLTEVASNDDSVNYGSQSEIIFDVVEGETYNIAVDGYNGNVGSINLELIHSTFNDQIDLSSTSLEVTPQQVNPGDFIEIDFSVENTGSNDAGGFWVDFFLSEDGNIDPLEDYLLGYTWVESVPGNSNSGVLSNSFSLPTIDFFSWDEDADYQIGMFVDRFDSVPETDESNNTDSETISTSITFEDQIDLSSSSLEVTPDEVSPGDSIEIDFSVENTGNDDAGSFYVDFFLSEDGNIDPEEDLFLGFTLIESLAGNSNTGVLSESLLLPTIDGFSWDEDADYQIGMLIDSLSQISETDESNNTDSEAISTSITFEDQIDLSSSSLEVTPDEVSPGDSIEIDFSVENTGSDDASNFYVDFFLSEDGDINPEEDFLLGFTLIESLAGNSNTGVLSESLLLPTTNSFSWDEDADYQIGMLVDSLSEISETNESNNTDSQAISTSTTTSAEPSYTNSQVKINGEYEPIAGDFNGDNNTDVLWYQPGPGQDFIWFFNSDNSYQSSPFKVNGTYTPIVGDFNGDSTSDILWYRPGPGQDYIWFFDQDGNRTSRQFTVNGTYTPVAGDFDASGTTDILWYRPGTGQDYLWSFNSDGSYNSNQFTVNGTYTPVAGDFDASGTTDVLWYRPGTGQDYLWSFNSDGSYNSNQFTVNGTYTPVTGDFDGSDTTDVLWYRPGTGQDFIWSFNSDGSYNSNQFTVNGTYTPITGDFNGNLFSDILWYRPGTGQDYLWSFQ
ncbi:MAG: S8 family serine peptidase [Okeania sp. SIO3B5]|uniref:S8 family serine peptidase n=1 Tax=Okeania sp. SIO3B5 TaxID=2607811 RepID=UPI0013FF740F|nr:S8 family serine peptidase [Okeania sp. SIO3B5]NEO52094.1 S8 family serine peptidase [Okeania sp. SIO3B5]